MMMGISVLVVPLVVLVLLGAVVAVIVLATRK